MDSLDEVVGDVDSGNSTSNSPDENFIFFICRKSVFLLQKIQIPKNMQETAIYKPDLTMYKNKYNSCLFWDSPLALAKISQTEKDLKKILPKKFLNPILAKVWTYLKGCKWFMVWLIKQVDSFKSSCCTYWCGISSSHLNINNKNCRHICRFLHGVLAGISSMILS